MTTKTIRYQQSCDNIPWAEVPVLLEKGEMSFVTPELHEVCFRASYACVFAFDAEKLVGIGRILSDGVRQSAMYDIAVDPEYRGFKIGKEIVNRLVASAPDTNFILYANIGKEGFYEKLSFAKLKTAMGLFLNKQRMIDKGFIEE